MRQKKPLVMFGTGKISEAVSFYFNRDSEYEILAYVIDDEYYTVDKFLEKPTYPLSKFLSLYSINDCSIFVSIGYQGINKVRKSKFEFFKDIGFNLASYKSPYVAGEINLGENSIVMDGSVFQPCVNLGNNVFVWGGAMIGHHAMIADHCWLTGGCLIGGAVRLGESSFVGMGAVLGQEVQSGIECMFGAGTLTTRSVGDKAVIISQNTEVSRLNSDQFTRLSACFRV